ncbi:hypothetical protein GCM10011507_02110 [Edaphobacter acidisoli]|uniref:Uncharacterized protein n=1 Tax=Edaphobacter acidisoli TaxID=2040573 RepID=A0A916REQ3_9BACT|nr:hypothetical protein GCM10011507_02110 [Edaphobacter acidisoli]
MLFVDRGVAPLKSRHFALIVVHANDLVAHLREADGSDKANITGTYNGNMDAFGHKGSEYTSKR